MKKNTLILIIAALIAAIIAAVILSGFLGTLTHPKPEDATVGYLLDIQKKPPADYIDVLEQVIMKNRNQTVRDTAVNTLTSLTIRKHDTEKVTVFLKNLTVNEEDPVIMSAAYAGMDRIRNQYPLPPMGSLDLSVGGNVRKGGEITITATISSTKNIDQAVLSIDPLVNATEFISEPVLYTGLTANTPLSHSFRIRFPGTGQFRVPVELMVSTDRTDYEQIRRTIRFDIRENGGDYTIR